MDSQVSYAYSLSSSTTFLHRGQYSSIPSARHFSCTRHSFFRHHGHSAQLPFILAFPSLFPIFASLFRAYRDLILVYALYIALYLSSEAAPVFPGRGGGWYHHNLPIAPGHPPPQPRRRIGQGSRGCGCLLHILHNHSCNPAESMPQLNKITILLTSGNPETIGNQGLSVYA